MKIKGIFILFFVFLMAIPFVTAGPKGGPIQVQSPGWFTIQEGQMLRYDLDDFVTNFSSYSITHKVDDYPLDLWYIDGYDALLYGVVRYTFDPSDKVIKIYPDGPGNHNLTLTVTYRDGPDSVVVKIQTIIGGIVNPPYQKQATPDLVYNSNSFDRIILNDYYDGFEYINYTLEFEGGSIYNRIIPIDGNFIYTWNNYMKLRIGRTYDGTDEFYLNITTYNKSGSARLFLDIYNAWGHIYDEFFITNVGLNTTLISNFSGQVPRVISTIMPQTLDCGDNITFYMNDIFEDYVFMQMSYPDYVAGQTTKIDMGENGTMMCDTSGTIDSCIYPVYRNGKIDMGVTFYKTDGDGIDATVTFTAFNRYGGANTNFKLRCGNCVKEGRDIVDVSGGDTILSYITDTIHNLFPPSDNLSSKQKYAFVFVTMLIVTLLILAMVQGTKIQYIGYAILFVQLLMVMYFFATGYLPVSYLVVGSLVLIAISYFKFKGGVS